MRVFCLSHSLFVLFTSHERIDFWFCAVYNSLKWSVFIKHTLSSMFLKCYIFLNIKFFSGLIHQKTLKYHLSRLNLVMIWIFERYEEEICFYHFCIQFFLVFKQSWCSFSVRTRDDQIPSLNNHIKCMINQWPDGSSYFYPKFLSQVESSPVNSLEIIILKWVVVIWLK